jgi:DNA-binding Xre family transcriptional regulator
MAIKVHLEEVLKQKGMTSKELSTLVGLLKPTCLYCAAERQKVSVSQQ